MAKRTVSLVYLWIGAGVLVTFLCGGYWLWQRIYLEQNRTTYRVIFCDVGQGDATLISVGAVQVLIDAGPNSQKISRCLATFMPWWDRTIEFAIATHADSDHIGGFEGVFSEFFIETLMMEYSDKETRAFSDFRTSLLEEKKQGMRVVVPQRGLRINPTQYLELYVLSPEVGYGWEKQEEIQGAETTLSAYATSKKPVIEDYNDRSIVLKATLFKTQILLTGDASEEVELALTREGLMGRVDVLKVGHHGSKTSSHARFLQETRPEHAVISSGKNNRYGHPHNRVLEELFTRDIQVWRTDQAGDIELRVFPAGYSLHSTPSCQNFARKITRFGFSSC